MNTEDCQLTAWTDGIDRNFLFGNANLQPHLCGEDRTPLVAAPAGKQALGPFEGAAYLYVQRGCTTFGAVRHDFQPTPFKSSQA